MITSLLQQSNIKAQIHGEHLQGGIGELQPIGIVRVMVNEEDAAMAKEIIIEWDRKQPDTDVAVPLAMKRSSGLGKLLLGFLIGVISVGVYYNTPVNYDGIDYNNDGSFDEKWTYRNYRMVKTEIDRNFDGKIDYTTDFTRKGTPKKSLADDDFNGSFETKYSYNKGSVFQQKVDSDGDGFNEYIIEYNYGVIATARFLNPNNENVIKIQNFELDKLVSAEYDSNKDGVIDTVIKYDEYGEIISTSAK
ncbi:DUF2007 domain-containing protein [Vibrio sp. DW001]|uniref:putative signal transducing protein n=1 Tax=Vibrio sp. DW001 TaxID=2912315 RepID=UPI0023B0BC26|nr:DUF2007 domain-containing protein [Vibrio sp. DW001]WED29422.1 DUF2007 domain-containing protein [Vibrio sp. DW001]